jgi:hypothetical protein
VNWQHLWTFVWLRWRLLVNQFKRHGTLNLIILGVLLVGAVVLAIVLFTATFLIGQFTLLRAPASAILLGWDGLVGGLLFFWMIGLLADLQRSEVLSLDKFMHLPVSLSGAFLINYLSSLFSVTLFVFLPPLVALCLALIITRGALMLLTLPLLGAFLLMVTALTYQFRGWLAALMVNKRRRNTILVVIGVLAMLIAQAPQLLNIMQPWGKGIQQRHEQMMKEQQELLRARNAGEITQQQYDQRLEEVLQRFADEGKRTWEYVQRIAWLANGVLPPGWLPYGAASLADGEVLPALLGLLGMTLIGTASLWRSYRTTVRLYKGEFTSGEKRQAPVRKQAVAGLVSPILLEKQLPWLSEQASAIALASFRSLTRAPEAKMMLLTPIMMVVIFGALLFRQSVEVPLAVRPLLAFGAMATTLLGMIQLMGNQFGFDRSGFRVYVLCSANRRDILLGKNLAMAPLGLGMSVLLVVLLQCIRPMRVDHFLAVLPQMVAMYLVFSMMANFLAIFAPVPVASGALKASNIRGLPLLLHFLFAFLFPLVLAPLALPVGVEFLVESLGGMKGLPICLVLSLLECGVVVLIYWLVLGWQGDLLHAREQKILEVVTTKAEG